MICRHSVREIVALLGPEDIILGDLEATFGGVAAADSVTEDTLDWISMANRAPLEYVEQSPAKVIICPLTIKDSIGSGIPGKTLILTANPNLLFSRVATKLFVKPPQWGIHPTAVIHPEAKISDEVAIGAFCVIGKVRIAERTTIAPFVYIDDDVEIGSGVLIKSGAKLGQAGFGFVRNEHGEFEKFPQLGGLKLKDKVEIGSNTTIDRGSLCDTIIGTGTKVSSQVVIAHNVQIGNHCFVGANAIVAGSARIGDNCWIAPSASIREHVQIGNSSVIGLGAVVLHSVPADQIWVGNPARFLRQTQ